MASFQEGSAEERAWAATTEEAAEVRRQRISELEAVEQRESSLLADARHQEREGVGIFDSLKENAKSVITAAKDATVGTAHDTADKARAVKDSAEEEARSWDATVAQGAGENQRTAAERASEGFAGVEHESSTVGDEDRGAKDYLTGKIGQGEATAEQQKSFLDADAQHRPGGLNHQSGGGGGLFESLKESTMSLISAAKEATVGTAHDAGDKAREIKDTAVQEARSPDGATDLNRKVTDSQDKGLAGMGYRGPTAEKSDEEKYTLGDEARGPKDYVTEKEDQQRAMVGGAAHDAKDNIVGSEKDKYTIRDAARDAKDYAGEKMGEEENKLKNAARNAEEHMTDSDRDKYTVRDAARDAKDYAGEKMDEGENKLKNAVRNAGEKMGEGENKLKNAARNVGEKMDEEENNLKNAARNAEEHMKDSDQDKYTVRDAARDAKDYAGEKMDEGENKLKNTARNAEEHMKDSDRDKHTIGDAAREAKDYAGEKVDEEENMLKNATKDVKGYIAEKKEELRKHFAGDAKERLGETPESAKTKLEIVEERKKEREETGWEDYERQRDKGERGSDATRNIYEAWPINIGSVTEALKQSMTMPEEIVAQKRREVASPAAGIGAPQGQNDGDVRATEEEGVAPMGKLDPHQDRKP